MGMDTLQRTKILNSLQGLIHTVSPSSINAQNGPETMDGLIMACIESRILVRTHYCTEKQGFEYPWISRKSPNTPTETH